MRFYIVAILFLFLSCKKERSCETCNTPEGYIDAIILYTGAVEVDGCSWVVKIGDDKYYHPDMLREEFKQDNLGVKICYTMTTGKFTCGIVGEKMSVIHVLDIKL